ncbi:unnamed protein product [Calypogeia fissa]
MGLYETVDGVISNAVFTVFERALGKKLSESTVTKGLPCVDSPTPIVLGLTSYLTFVITGLLVIKSRNLKPRAKEPLILQIFVIFHNTCCFLLSLYMCLGIIRQAILNRYSLWGNAYNPEQVEMAHLVYIFYMSKYIEFLDTVIMILKSSTRQITVLHVYHHASISFIWWVIAYNAPGGEAYFSAAMNSGVHVAMYLYYLLAATLGKDEKVRRKYLWWGKYLTQLQMFQFCLNLAQAYTNLKNNAPYPRFLSTILFYYMISLLVLFANFYVHRYTSPSEKKEGKVPKSRKAE